MVPSYRYSLSGLIASKKGMFETRRGGKEKGNLN
jgi:hypothetical protein